MIPKIAHFHWDGPPMGWLRMMGVHSFIRQNSEWEVRLIRTAPIVKAKNLPLYAQQADWTWAETLLEHGGFSFGTDTIFLEPIPDEWCEAKMCACTNGGEGLFHGTIGSEPGTSFLQRYAGACRVLNGDKPDYQAYGTTLMKEIVKQMGGSANLRKRKNFYDMPVGAMTPVLWSNPSRFWNEEPLDLPAGTVAVTWYGGSESAREREYLLPGKGRNAAIVKLALEACS